MRLPARTPAGINKHTHRGAARGARALTVPQMRGGDVAIRPYYAKVPAAERRPQRAAFTSPRTALQPHKHSEVGVRPARDPQ